MILSPLLHYQPELLAIEQAAHLVPWPETSLQECFGARYTVVGGFYQGKLIGFYIMQEIAGEQTLINIAIHPSYQGRGFGSVLCNDLLLRASNWQQGQLTLAVPIFLEVRESNQAAIRLYERYGFKLIGKRAHYYPLPASTEKETALVYSRQAYR